jgi:hypothetical protein
VTVPDTTRKASKESIRGGCQCARNAGGARMGSCQGSCSPPDSGVGLALPRETIVTRGAGVTSALVDVVIKEDSEPKRFGVTTTLTHRWMKHGDHVKMRIVSCICFAVAFATG